MPKIEATTVDVEPKPLIIYWPKLLIILFGINALLMAASMARDYIPRAGRLLHIGLESNIPAWFSGLQIALISLPTLVRGIQLRNQDPRSHWKIYMLMAAGFFFLSVDEIVQIHEPLGHALNIALHNRGFTFIHDDYRGLVPLFIYGLVGLVCLFLLRRDLRALLSERVGSKGLFVGLAVFATGGVLVDIFMPPFENPYLREASMVLEESLEIAGMSILLVTFLVKLGTVQLVVVGPDRRPRSDSSSADASPSALVVAGSDGGFR